MSGRLPATVTSPGKVACACYTASQQQLTPSVPGSWLPKPAGRDNGVCLQRKINFLSVY